MMMISRTGTHTLKALVALHQIPVGSYAGANRLARQIHAPSNYLGKLLRQIARAGIVEGRKGRNGGFRLTGAWRSVSLFDALSPVEHFDSFKKCILGKQKCSRANPCPLHQGWSHIRDQYREYLNTTTLSDLTEDRAAQSDRKSSPQDRQARSAGGGVR